MALGIFEPKTLLRCISLCIIVGYFYLVVNQRILSGDNLESFMYAATYTKARRYRQTVVQTYDFTATAARLSPFSLICPYLLIFPYVNSVFGKAYDFIRVIRPYFKDHVNWSYQRDVENDSFHYFESRKFGQADSYFQLGVMIPLLMVVMHACFSKSVVMSLVGRERREKLIDG